MEGIELIQRKGDLMVGIRGRNSTTRFIDTELQIGPVQFIMDQREDFPLKFSRVSSPPLVAQLRLTVRNHFIRLIYYFYIQHFSGIWRKTDSGTTEAYENTTK